MQSIRWSLVAFLCCSNTVKVERGRDTGLRTGPSTDCYPYPSSITWSPLALTQNILIVFIHSQTPLSLLIHGHPVLRVRKPLYVHVWDPSVELFMSIFYLRHLYTTTKDIEMMPNTSANICWALKKNWKKKTNKTRVSRDTSGSSTQDRKPFRVTCQSS